MKELLYEYLLYFFVTLAIGFPILDIVIDRKRITSKVKRICGKIIEVFDRGNNEEAALRFVNDVNRRKYIVKFK